MPTQIQFRRGTTSQHSTFTGAVGEMTIDTDKDTAIVHDGATAGGYELLRADLNNLSNPQFTGTGSIGIPTGTTAQRPTSPSIGDFRYNTTLNSMEWYNTDGTSSGWLSWGP